MSAAVASHAARDLPLGAEQITALLESREGRRALASQSIDFFKSYYLGLQTPACQTRWQAACLQHRRYLQLAPRAHGKTETLTRVIPLWLICMSATGLRRDVAPENVRILLAAKKEGAAAKFLLSLKADLEGNARLIEDFGPFRDPDAPWGETKIYCRRTRRGIKDPTVEIVGARGAITGGRFDWIITDDIEDDENTHTADRRLATREWFHGTVEELLEPSGRLVAIGTRKHADDLYSHLLKRDTWRATVDRAIVRWPGGGRRCDPTKWRVRYVDVPVDPEDPSAGTERKFGAFSWIAPGWEVLWPERWSVAALLLKYLGSYTWLFNRENQQEIIDDARAVFPIAPLHNARRRGLKLPLYRAVAEQDGKVYLLPGGGVEALPEGLRALLRPPGWRPAEEAPPEIEDGEEAVLPLPRDTGEGMLIFQAWDLSLVDEEGKLRTRDTDYTVGVTFGLIWRTRELVLLDLFRGRHMSTETIKSVIQLSAARWRPRYVAIERNAFGSLYTAGLRRTTDLPIVPHLTTSKKLDPYEGVPALSGLFELGKIILPYSGGAENTTGRALVDLFIAEFNGLGVEAHDDIVMATWICRQTVARWVAMVERGRNAHPPNEAADAHAP